MASPLNRVIKARQIAETDIKSVAELFAKGFPERGSQFWLNVLTQLTDRRPPAGLPRYGYLLECNGDIVGGILLIFSNIRTESTCTTRCNVSSWYVETAFRNYAALLASQALKLRNVTYLNVTAAPGTRAIVETLGYARYSEGLFIAIPALNFGPDGARVKVLGVEQELSVPFDPLERDLLLEHAKFGCISLWCVTPEYAYPFVFRPRVIRGIITYTQLIYCRKVEDFVRFAAPVGRFLLRRGHPFVFIDSNRKIPGLVGRYFDGRMPKYFKGADRPRLGDLAYTEIAMFGA
jgi:hypothetical protein